jgi:hypothetical protein
MLSTQPKLYTIRTVDNPSNTQDRWAVCVNDGERVFGPANLHECCRQLSRLISAEGNGVAVRLWGQVTQATDPMYDPLCRGSIHKSVPASELPATVTRWLNLGRKITAIVADAQNKPSGTKRQPMRWIQA